MNLIQAERALAAYLAADIPVFIWGAPGIGKSDLVASVAAKRNGGLIDVRAILLDPVDLRGLPAVLDGRSVWAQPDFLPRAERDGAEGILFLDELNAAPASVQAACFQLVLNRRLGEYAMPKGWRIVAAGNRQSDRASAQRMPSALANRFAHIDADADVTAWTQWAISTNLAAVVLAFIRFRPELLHKMDGSDLRAFPTPRAWSNVAKIADAPDDIRLPLVAGLVGEGAAAEFEGFIRIWRTLPPIADLIANPDGAAVPSDPATLYAVSSALARAATPKNFGNVCRYAKRLPPEFGVVLAVDAVKRTPALQETAAFVQWSADNQHVTL